MCRKISSSRKAPFVEAKLKQGVESATQKKIVRLDQRQQTESAGANSGNEIRVTGKSRDDLQAVMAMVRGGDLGQPFQSKTSAINRDNLRFVHVRCSINACFRPTKVCKSGA
ncbi:DUF520 family protein [Escherichia coli]